MVRKNTLKTNEEPDRNASPQIEWVSVDAVRKNPRNARTHSKKQIQLIANSIDKVAFLAPILIDEAGVILAGHGRLEAARLLGRKSVPTIRFSHLNDTQKRAFLIADNKIAEKAGWDREMLAIELGELRIALPEAGLDIDLTGFEPGEVDSLMLDFANERPSAADVIPETETKVVAKFGDIFLLGRHRLVVGDARKEQAYKALMGAAKAEMAFLDPPYNVRINGHVGGRGRIKHREFSCASGEMTSSQFVGFLKETLGLCARHTIDGSINYVCMDWGHAGELLEAGAAAYDELKNICVWTKTTPGQGSFYRSQHEFVFVYKHGQSPHLNTFELGQHGRSRSNVWSYPGANMFRAGRMDELKMHPTVKPVALVSDTMRDCSRRGAIILDAFAGSGTTIMAAEQIGRRAFCIEIDPQYVDVAIRRWQHFTGKDAVLEETQQSFQELSEGCPRKRLDTKGTRLKAAKEARR